MASDYGIGAARLRGSGSRFVRVLGRRWRVAALVGIAVVAVFATAWGYDRVRSDVIGDGVRAGPISLGGLSTSAATARLAGAAAATERRRLVLVADGKRLAFVPAKAGVAVDVHAMVARALAVGRGGGFLGRDWRALTGTGVRTSIAPSLASASVPALARLATRLGRRPRDAAVAPRAAALHVIPARPGTVVAPAAVGRAIATVLLTGGSRVVVPTQLIAPRVTLVALRRRYRSYITIDRGGFTLRVYRHLRLVRSYAIAVGMQGLQTPAGLYHVQNKVIDPAWDVPNSPWAGALAGQVIPPGPQDPLKARWLGLWNGAGIHGTDETDSIGHAFSHGCVRMLIPDVIDLYNRVQVGSPVYIGD